MSTLGLQQRLARELGYQPAATTATSALPSKAAHGDVSSGMPVGQAGAGSFDRQLQLRVAGSALTLKPGLTYIIGSDPDAHVHLGGADVAPRHAQISNDELRVLHATGGIHRPSSPGANPRTLLNGREVEAGIAAPLREGDVIRIGAHDIAVHAITGGSDGVTGGQRGMAQPPMAMAGSGATGGVIATQRHEQSSQIPPVAVMHQGSQGYVPEKEASAATVHSSGGKLPQPMGSPGHGGVYGQPRFDDKELDRGYDYSYDETNPSTLQQGMQAMAIGTAAGIGAHQQQAHQQPLSQVQQRPQQQEYVVPQQQSTAHPIVGTRETAQAPVAIVDHSGGLLGATNHRDRQKAGLPPSTTDTPVALYSDAELGGAGVAGAGAGVTTTTTTEVHFSDRSTMEQLASTQLPQMAQTTFTRMPVSSAPGTGAGEAGSAATQQDSTPTTAQTTTTSQSDSFVLAPAYSSVELATILSDMVDLSGYRMSRGALHSLPHWFSLFPPEQRQSLGSAQLKIWLRKAQEERQARLASKEGAAGGYMEKSVTNAPLQSDTAQSSGSMASSSGGSHTTAPVSAATAARALLSHGLDSSDTSGAASGTSGASSGLSTDPLEMVESDFVFGLLAMQAEADAAHHSTAGSMQTNDGLGGTRLAPSSTAISSTASSLSPSAGSSEFALLTLLGDLAEVGSWQLSPGWESAVRYMLDEQHMAPHKRARINSGKMKAWLRAAVMDRERQQQGPAAGTGVAQKPGGVTQAPSGTQSDAGARDSHGGCISALNLAHALVTTQHQI